MPELVSSDGDALRVTPAEYEFLRNVSHELRAAHQRGQHPVVCVLYEGKRVPAGIVFVPPPEPDAAFSHEFRPDGTASQVPALEKPRGLETDAADADDEPGDSDLEPDDDHGGADELTPTDEVILGVLGDAAEPLKRATIARRGRINNNTYLSQRFKALLELRKIRRLPGHFYWLADRALPPQIKD